MKRHALCLTALAALLLSACCNDWEPVPRHLMTSWGKEVDPSSVLPEYPRPGLVRTDAEGLVQWQSLNGLWNYAIVPADDPVYTYTSFPDMLFDLAAAPCVRIGQILIKSHISMSD